METKTKYILAGTGIVAVVGGYYLYNYLSKKGSEGATEDVNDLISEGKFPNGGSLPAPRPKVPTRSPRGYVPASSNASLPLKRGSKGTLVKDVQLSLIRAYGGTILPKYGADGFYGKEMELALKSKGFSTTVDSELYGKLLKGKSTDKDKVDNDKGGKGKSDSKNFSKTYAEPSAVAKAFHTSIKENDIYKAMQALFKVKDVNHYIKINEKFKKTRIDFVTKTLVTALLDRFIPEAYVKKIKGQLYRIGLKLRSGKWELSGMDTTTELITIKRAKIWDKEGGTMSVPNATLIGEFLEAKNGITEFQTIDGRQLFVETTAIRYQ